jgi:hypothetical protein
MHYTKANGVTIVNVCVNTFGDNSFTKTLLFCTNFLRKIIKINIFDQLLYFAILCANHMENTLYITNLLTTLTCVIVIFESNYFIKTLLFCANFLRKTTKIKFSEQLLYFVILCKLFQPYVKQHCTQTCF